MLPNLNTVKVLSNDTSYRFLILDPRRKSQYSGSACLAVHRDEPEDTNHDTGSPLQRFVAGTFQPTFITFGFRRLFKSSKIRQKRA